VYHVHVSTIKNAILKALIYSNIFDYPLTPEEVHRYLPGVKLTRETLTQSLQKLVESKKIGFRDDYYFLAGREKIVHIRQKRAEISRRKISKAQKYGQFLKLIPWLKMVAITGTLAVANADEEDDIDLFFDFAPERLFLGRIFEYLILKTLGVRRHPRQQEVSDRLCPNLYLTQASLHVEDHDLYIAREVLQVQPLWERGQVFAAFLRDNAWVSDFFPNAVLPTTDRKPAVSSFFKPVGDFWEKVVRFLQLHYMARKRSKERVSAQALYFHPGSVREHVLTTYQKELRRYHLA
jgi:hypothetical protein